MSQIRADALEVICKICLESSKLDIVGNVPDSMMAILRKCKESLNLEHEDTNIDWVRSRLKPIIEHCRSWYQLNCGSWKDVCDYWRHLYGIASLMSIVTDFVQQLCETSNDDLIKDLICQCDRAILMGGPAIEPLVSELIAVLVRSCSDSEPLKSNMDIFERVAQIDMDDRRVKEMEVPPTIETFDNEFFRKGKPVLLNGCISHWPAMKSWSFEYFVNLIGDRIVPVEIGSNYADIKWTQKLMTFKKFYHEYLINKENLTIGYLAQHPLLDQIPKLRQDVCVPDFCCLGTTEVVDMNIWIGPADTISPLHQDPKPNLLCQIRGTKFVRMISPEYRAFVYPFPSTLISNTSQMDVMNPDYEKFPLFRDVPYMDTILRPGTMLYIPPNYWHYVKSLSPSISLSIWFE